MFNQIWSLSIFKPQFYDFSPHLFDDTKFIGLKKKFNAESENNLKCTLYGSKNGFICRLSPTPKLRNSGKRRIFTKLDYIQTLCKI